MSKIEDQEKCWDEALCPICMEHPHNAILLICSSHDIGCRPFMCDTTYPHSNCFDQFRNSVSEESSGGRRLVCPLCRGSVSGWRVIESARRLMNAKSRSCCRETCDFSGPYHDLCKHAKSMHRPLAGPTATDGDLERRPGGNLRRDQIISTVERHCRWWTPENVRAIQDRMRSLEPSESAEVRFLVCRYVELGRHVISLFREGGDESSSNGGGRRVRRRLNDG